MSGVILDKFGKIAGKENIYRMKGTPDAGDGRKLLTQQELNDLQKKPGFWEAVRRCEQEEGHEKAISKLYRKQVVGSQAARVHEAEAKMLDKMQAAKAKEPLMQPGAEHPDNKKADLEIDQNAWQNEPKKIITIGKHKR